jgi:hypothetical protein
MLDSRRAPSVRLGSLLPAVALVAACSGGAGYAPVRQATPADYPGRPVATAGDYGRAPSTATAGGGDAIAVQSPYTTPTPTPSERPGLGTSWGEQVWSPATTQPFVRAAIDPWAAVALHYNDRDGVSAHAGYLGATPTPLEVYAGDGSIGISLVDEAGQLLPGINAAGRALVAGEDGARYRIVVRNGTSARFEIVASVDGLDVIDGKPASVDRRGYIVDPYGTLVIDGFRTSDAEVAAFRFGRVAESYASQTSGDRNVGVVGVAIFAERGAVWTPAELDRRDTADPFPAGRAYATPP